MKGSGVMAWNAHVVVAAVTEEMERRMEEAAKVVEVDARHRLLAIREPEFGQGYRRVLALFRLKSVVKRTAREIVGTVGIPAGDKGDSYGFYIETGSRTAGAQPWLRPALLTNLATIKQLLGAK